MTLPGWFFEPAPLRRPGVLAEGVEKRYWRSRSAIQNLMRMVAFVCGFGLFFGVILLRGRWDQTMNPGSWQFNRIDVWVEILLAMSALSVIVAGFRHQWEWYLLTFRLTAGIYISALTYQVIGLLNGSSPLGDLHLSDFAGYPAVLLILSAPRKIGFPLAFIMMAVVSATHQGWPLTMANLVEAAWAFLVVLPFMLLLISTLRVCEEIDQEASRRHAADLRLARSRSLLEAETRFLGYMHDQVLHHLDGVRRGLIAPEPLPVYLPSDMLEVGGSLKMRPERAVLELIDTLHRQDPELRVDHPTEFPSSGGVPADVMNLISDAALEALDNSMKHAAGSDRHVEISFLVGDDDDCTGFTATLVDEGPGFRVEQIPAERAGVRVSILGRMSSMPGLSARVDSTPGKGTRVRLKWREPKQQMTQGLPGEQPRSIRNIFDPGRIYNPIFAVFVFLVCGLMGLGHQHGGNGFEFAVAMFLLLLAMVGLMRGKESKLPRGTTLMVVVCICLFLLVAAREPLGENGLWPPVWYPLVLTLMCLLLAIRGRIIFAWILNVGGFFAIHWIEQDLFVLEYLSPEKMTGLLHLLIPGTLAPLAVRWILKSLSAVMLGDSAKETDLVVAATRRSYLTDSAAWLERQLSAVLDPALSEPRRIFSASLLELRLRDAIRSPGFDERETNRQVWQARRRGVTVKLSDDRSDAHGVDPDPQPLTHAATHHALQRMLWVADIRVTARMLPVGRSIYATILAEFWGDDGEPDVKRIQITPGMSLSEVDAHFEGEEGNLSPSTECEQFEADKN
ncbi:hypothetical protein COCCU_05605 [Corynebacterium occultum]|uniref:Histidine kinase/HSP90-like ATPase domain-containing protein n=1 Tax=Corynebacterium occultum TaxID=2675219 RepID=A0A6B8W6X1_9CORY|nr:ATP-binding protein [Corynebacterium occultum]QGU07065.1 hypothetical protein COCCU_05605 [Corynebacterium occultum]